MKFVGFMVLMLAGIWVWEKHPALVILVGMVLGLFIVSAIFSARAERDRVALMTQEEREAHEREKPQQVQTALFGPVNEHLVCPAAGQVRSKAAIRQAMLMTNTIGRISATTTNQITQRHCGKCSSTWDI